MNIRFLCIIFPFTLIFGNYKEQNNLIIETPDEIVYEVTNTFPMQTKTVVNDKTTSVTTPVMLPENTEGKSIDLHFFDDFIKDYLTEEQASIFTEDFITTFLTVCEEQDIDPWLAIAVIEHESSFIPDAVASDNRHFGLMQLSEKYHMDKIIEIGGNDILDPEDNITVGISYLAEIRSWCKGLSAVKTYPYDCPLESLMVMSYNSGFGNALPIYEENGTTAYQETVIKKYLRYKNKYKK